METTQQVKPTETTPPGKLTKAGARRLEAELRTPPALRPLAPLPPGCHAVEPVRLTTEQFVQLHGKRQAVARMEGVTNQKKWTLRRRRAL